MFYEEKLIDGVLYCRSDPKGEWRPVLTDEQVDRILGTRIPGGSAARDWFLPHEHPKGLQNVRDVVRRMMAATAGVQATAPKRYTAVHWQPEGRLEFVEDQRGDWVRWTDTASGVAPSRQNTLSPTATDTATTKEQP